MNETAKILNIQRSHDITPDIGVCSNCGNKVYIDWEQCYYCKAELSIPEPDWKVKIVTYASGCPLKDENGNCDSILSTSFKCTIEDCPVKYNPDTMPNTVEPTGKGVLEDSVEDGELSLCPTCNCMTKGLKVTTEEDWVKCGKCGSYKPSDTEPVTSDKEGSYDDM